MKAKKENKYLMMKIEDVENYFSQFTKGVFTTAEEQAVIEQEPFWKVVNELGKHNKNKYIIINQDEPYAEEVWQTILKGEDAKNPGVARMKVENQFTIMWLRNFMLFFNVAFVIASILGFVIITNFANAISQEIHVAYIYNSFTIAWIVGFVMLGLFDIIVYYVWRKAKNPVGIV